MCACGEYADIISAHFENVLMYLFHALEEIAFILSAFSENSPRKYIGILSVYAERI